MRTTITYFFVTLGVIFFVLILSGAYFWYTDVWGVRTFVSLMQAEPPATTQETSVDATTQQRERLESFGLDPNIMDSLTAEDEDCFAAAIGADRVAEIKAGAIPTMSEFAASADCL